MSNWYYYNEKGEKIAATGGQLKGLAKAGLITPETIIENEEGKSAPAGKVKGLTFSAQADTASKSTIIPSDSNEVYGLAAPPSPANPFTASMPETIDTPVAAPEKPTNPFTTPLSMAMTAADQPVATKSAIEKSPTTFPPETERTSVADSSQPVDPFAASLPVVVKPVVNPPAPAKRAKGLTFCELAEEDDSVSNKSEVAKIGWMSPPNALKTASQQENPEAMFYFGYFSLQGYLHDGNNSNQSKQTAAQCFTQGAKFAAQDSAAGLCCAGLCSEFGLGVTKDDLTAVKSYEKAAKMGFAFAYLCLAHAYSAGGEFIEKDLKEAAVYSSMAFEQLMRECEDEKDAIELVVLQCNYSFNVGDLGDHLNIESSKCPKEFRKAFEACLEHFNKFLEVANQVMELNQQYVTAIDNLNSGAGNAVVDGVADALGRRRWMFDLKGGAVDAGISLLTNAVSGTIKMNQAKAALDANYQNEYNKLYTIRREIGERVKESANRVQKIAARYGVAFNCFDSTVEGMMQVQAMNSVPQETEKRAIENMVANASGTGGQKSGCLVLFAFLGLLAAGSSFGCLVLLATLFPQ